jgi:hypothetical protein
MPPAVPTAGVDAELAMRLLRASGDQLAAGALEQIGRMAGQVGWGGGLGLGRFGL